MIIIDEFEEWSSCTVDVNEWYADTKFEFYPRPPTRILFHTFQLSKHSLEVGIDYYIGKALLSQKAKRHATSIHVIEYQTIASAFYSRMAANLSRKLLNV